MKKTLLKSALLLIAFTVPLYAEEIASADPLAQCYEATQNIETNVKQAIQTCLVNKVEESTKLLDSAYGQAKAALESIDSVATVDAVKALEKSQAVFIEFRDAECERESAAMMGGTGSGDILLSCKAQLNNWRVDQLSQ